MDHAVITRLLYREEDPKFEERLALYKTLHLPRLEMQTVKDFDIIVLCNRKHGKIFESMGITPIYTKDGFLGHFSHRLYNAYIPFENIEGMKKYDIQTSLDSDDLVADNYIQKIREVIEQEGYDKSLHIHFQEELYNPHTFEIKKMRTRYRSSRGSAFYSLYQPDKERYVYIGADSHTKMQNYAEKSILIEEGYCWAMVHGSNNSTTINH